MFSGQVFLKLRNISGMPLPLTPSSKLSYFSCIRVIFLLFPWRRTSLMWLWEETWRAEPCTERQPWHHLCAPVFFPSPCFGEPACPGSTSGRDLKESNSQKQRGGWSLQGNWGRCCTVGQYSSYTECWLVLKTRLCWPTREEIFNVISKKESNQIS